MWFGIYSFGENIPENWEEIVAALNELAENLRIETLDEANLLWEDYCNGWYSEIPAAVF